MKTALESKNLLERFSLRQREAEVLANFVQHNPKLAKAAVAALAKRYSRELKGWSKAMFYQNSGRSYSLTLADFEAAAMRGLQKTAEDYNPTHGATFKTWLYYSVYSFCSYIARRNETRLKMEVQESRLTTKENDDEDKIISIEELSDDDRLDPRSLSLSSWFKYKDAQRLVKWVKETLHEKALHNQKKEQNKANRVLDFIEFFLETSEVKEDFFEEYGCSPTTLNNNLKELANGALKEIKDIATRHHSKNRKQEEKVKQTLAA